MKSIKDIILESSNKWWTPFIELFQSHVEEILKSGNCQYKPNTNAKVVKSGSDRSTVFGIRYNNKQGVSCKYEFCIPDTSSIPSVGVYHVPTNEIVNELIRRNKKKLPKLKFDILGNVIC